MKMKFRSIEIHIKQNVKSGGSYVTQAFLLRESTASILECVFPDLEGVRRAGASLARENGVVLCTCSEVWPSSLV